MFVNVEDCEALDEPTFTEPKERAVGASPTAGAGTTPDPVSCRLCGLSAALSTIWIAAVRLPVAAGVKATVKVQLAPAASVAGEIGHVCDIV